MKCIPLNCAKKFATLCLALAALVAPFGPAQAADKEAAPAAETGKPLRIVALGDSLTAGYGLESEKDFASQLEKALKAEGYNVKVENAGVSGDTTAGGLSRLEWALAVEDGEPKVRLMIIALGANDLLRGVDPRVTRENLEAILTELKDREVRGLLVGMQSPGNMGPTFQRRYDKIFPAVAEKYDVPFYPFFLEGVAMKPEFNLADGMHPNAAGVAIMVKNILPTVKEALKGLEP